MSNAISNEDLVALRAGKTDALQKIFFAHHPKVFQRILLIVKDAAIADDLAQEVFIRLWEKRDTLSITSNFSAYLQKMALNEGLGYLRSRAAKTVTFQSEEDTREAGANAVELLIGEDMEKRIQSALGKLPTRCRAIFLLSRKQGLTYQQIADQLEISKKTVENQMGKALQIMRNALLSAAISMAIPFFL